MNLISYAANRSVARTPTPPGIYDGRWMTVRLQLFPDGRCVDWSALSKEP